jgi:peptide/nickel transport system permease protein
VRALIHRCAESLLLLWLVVSLTFLLAHLAPGDAAELLVSPSASSDEVMRLRRTLGLDASLPAQYARWVGGVLTGDLGESFALREPVRDVLLRALPVTLGLGLTSLALTFANGGTAGLYQARRGRWPDRLLTAIGITVFAAPSFWLALSCRLFTAGASWWDSSGLASGFRLGWCSPASTATGWRVMVRWHATQSSP